MATSITPARHVRVGARTWSRWTTQCRLVVRDVTTSDRAFELADDLMDDIDEAINWFDPDSELSRLRPGTTHVSDLLSWFLRIALRAAEQTDGLVDPTAGTRPGGSVVPDASAPGAATWRDIVVTDTAVTMPAGLRLDLGATGKAAAADLVADRIHRVLGTATLVSLGGDIATAGTSTSEWDVDVQDAARDPLVTVSLAPGAAIATSSTLHRRWSDPDGEPRHHVVDPGTGTSAAGPWRTVTVVAPTCVEANTASTAAIIHGAGAVDWLARAGLPARLVDHDARVTTVNGFPGERDL